MVCEKDNPSLEITKRVAYKTKDFRKIRQINFLVKQAFHDKYVVQ